MDEHLNHEERIALARAFVLLKAPYFGDVVHGFVYHALEGIGTMLVTSTMILGYDPIWATVADTETLAADIVHEVHHYVRKHFVRGATVDDPKLFNYAGDLAINPELVAGGWKLSPDSLFPEQFGLPNGLTTEEYYERLKEMKAKGDPRLQDDQPSQQPGQQPQQQGQAGGQPNGQQPGSGGQQPSEKPGSRSGSSPQGQGQQPGQQPGQGQGGPGQGQGKGQGQPQPGQGGQGQKKGVCQGHCGGMGGFSDHKGLEKELDATPDLGRSPGEIDSIEKRTVNAIKQHVESHGRGSVPGSLQSWVQNFEEESVTPWREELAHILRDATGRMQSGGDDFSLRRPSRRSVLRGILRPGMIENLPEIAIIRDSSGSMGAEQLTVATREAYAIMQALGIDEVWFADADTKIATPWKRVGPQFFRELKEAHGRGGTDFRPGVESAQKLHPPPDLLVYVTDGDGTTTKMPPPNITVVWAIVPSYYNKAPARWGHCVVISDDAKVRRKGVTYGKPGEYADDDNEDTDAAAEESFEADDDELVDDVDVD